MTHEFQHEFKGYGRVPSTCSVKVVSTDNEHAVYFEDLNHGTSVTNASEQLASEIVDMLNLSPEDCRFFETYTREEFDEITYEWEFKRNKWIAKDPVWKPADFYFTNLFIS
jgi:hypothetical protein